MTRRRRFLAGDIAVVVAVAAATAVLVVLDRGSSGPSVAATVTVEPSHVERAIPSGFLGLSFEYDALEPYAGTDPAAIDPVFVQLVRNLAPGQRPELRIGGDTTDTTWWPVPGVTPPPGVTYALSDRWLAVASALTAALRAHLILGINLEADSQVLAAGEAQALIGALGSDHVQALELGNEAALYSVFTWYRTAAGTRVTGRARGYDFPAFVRDYAHIAAALPDIPLAGPALNDSGWIKYLPEFLAAEPRVAIVTVHRYPLQLCFVPKASPLYPSVSNLLSPAASAGLAQRLAPAIATALAHRVPLRLDEINTVSCGSAPAVSRSFAAALWSLDVAFELARAGAGGVNFHTFPSAGYNMFSFTHAAGHWSGSVAPQYYGLLLFAEAAPRGARLVGITGGQPDWLRTWATRSRAGTVRVVLINVGDAPRLVAVALPGSGTRPGTVVRLTAPSPESGTGITLAGRSFGAQTTTGKLAGRFERFPLARQGLRYLVPMPSYSAALVTIAG